METYDSMDEVERALEAFPPAVFSPKENTRINAFIDYAGRFLWPLELNEDALNFGACQIDDRMHGFEHFVHKGYTGKRSLFGRRETAFWLVKVNTRSGSTTLTRLSELDSVLKVIAAASLYVFGPRDELQRRWVNELGIVPRTSKNPVTETVMDGLLGPRTN